MPKKRGGRFPKIKRGRLKGNKNKIIRGLKEALEVTNSLPKWRLLDVKEQDVALEYVKDYPKANMKSRLDECMIRFETAVAEAISKLKEMI